jgi:hypothetical protein
LLAAPFTDAELTRTGPIWLLEVEYAGIVHRWASHELDVDTDDGGSVHYDGGLAIDLTQTFGLLSDSPDRVSIPVAVFFQVDVAAVEQLGHDLSACRAELSAWVDGRTYEERQVQLVGKVVNPVYGAEGEPVTFSIAENAGDDHGLVPAPTWRVTPETWANADEAVIGRYYPIPFNRPGKYVEIDGTEADTTGSPVLLVQTAGATRYGLIAGLATAAGRNGGTVRIINLTKELAVSLTAEVVTDALGQEVTVVDLVAQMAGGWEVGDELWCRWDDSDGGVISRRGTTMKGAGEILRWWLEQVTIPVDFGRFAVLEDPLNAYELCGYIDEPIKPWDFIRRHLLPILPVSMASGPEGLYPILWRSAAEARDAVVHLRAGHDCVRRGPVTREGGQPVNEIRLEFAKRGDTREFRRALTITGNPSAADLASAEVMTSLHSRASHARYGRGAKSMQSEWIALASTAALVLHDRVRLEGFRRRGLVYGLDRIHWSLQRGDEIRITDPEMHFDEQLVLVRARTPVPTGVDVELVLLEDPVRDSRA